MTGYKQIDPSLYVVARPHPRGQRARLALLRFRHRVEDRAAGLVLLCALVLILLVEMDVVSIFDAVRVFSGLLGVAFLLLIAEAATMFGREWRKRGQR